jgi:hypothetical protein
MQKLSQIPARYAGLAVLCLLTLAYLALFRFDAYGIDEGAARALLLNWSIGSEMLSPVAVLGFPDMRALLLAPLNFHWVGELIAAKVLTMYLTFAAALMVYRWAEKNLDDETALFATGLWLIAPLTISQVDSIGAGNYLIFAAVVIYWIEIHFRAAPQAISGYYFVLLLLVALAVSMHPAGLGIAAALAWSWLRDHGGNPHKRNMFLLGMGVMIFFILFSRMGWPELALLSDPLPALGNVITGPAFQTPSVGLALLGAALLIVILVTALNRKRGLLSSMLSFAVIFGALAPDNAWAELVLVLILYEGLGALLALNSRMGNSLLARRGLVAVAFVLLSTTFMVMDKHRYFLVHGNQLSYSDELIAELDRLEPQHDTGLLVASQWPGRTMLATRRGALPLPPVGKEPEDRDVFLKKTRGISFMIFDHHDPRNAVLTRQVAELSDHIKTVEVLPGGVVLKMPTTETAPQKSAQPAERKQ